MAIQTIIKPAVKAKTAAAVKAAGVKQSAKAPAVTTKATKAAAAMTVAKQAPKVTAQAIPAWQKIGAVLAIAAGLAWVAVR